MRKRKNGRGLRGLIVDFSQVDRNGNGQISKEELNAAQQAQWGKNGMGWGHALDVDREGGKKSRLRWGFLSKEKHADGESRNHSSADKIYQAGDAVYPNEELI